MSVQFQVFANQSAYDSRKVLFERIINVPFGVSVPYEQILDVFKFMFGEFSIVQFRCV